MFPVEPSKHKCRVACCKIGVHKTTSKFSAKTIDQCHEQDDGAVKIWAALGRLQSQKWQDRLLHVKRIRWSDNQQPYKTLRIFTMKVTCSAIFLPQRRPISHSFIQDMGNPFLEESNDLLVLDTRYIMESFAGNVVKVNNIGQDQYSKFVDELLSKCVTPVADPLPKNKRPFFNHPAVKEPSKGRLQHICAMN